MRNGAVTLKHRNELKIAAFPHRGVLCGYFSGDKCEVIVMGRGASGGDYDAPKFIKDMADIGARYGDRTDAEIELSEGLRYEKLNGEPLSDAARLELDDFENQYRREKTEYGLSLSENGDIIDKKHGDEGSVRMDRFGYIFTHIHPRQPGWLGGPFSLDDMRCFLSHPQTFEFRAVAKEGTYRIQKTPRMNDLAFYSYVSRHYDAIYQKAEERLKTINANMRTYKDYDTYSREFQKGQNQLWVDLHNMYRRAAKKFGFKYALERRA